MTDPVLSASQALTQSTATPSYSRTPDQVRAQVQHAAQEFEAVFLTEMLKHAGMGKMSEVFNGGVGEAAFSDFLLREYAMDIAENRSIGIADRAFASLMAGGER